MSDADFLSQYDSTAFPPMAVAVDIVVLAANEQGLFVLTARRAGPPHRGKYALPGVLLGTNAVGVRKLMAEGKLEWRQTRANSRTFVVRENQVLLLRNQKISSGL
jgi:hypothetical protein